MRQIVCQRILSLNEFPNCLKEVIIISLILVGGTQTILAKLKCLCQSPKANEQCRKRWSIDSPLPLHKMHQCGPRDLQGLLTYSKSLVFTFLYTTNQAKALPFKEAFDFQTKSAKKKGLGFKDLDLRTWTRPKRKIFIGNKPEEYKDHALESTMVGDKARI